MTYNFRQLTARERSVIEALIVHGYAKNAAHSLNISVQTFKNYNTAIIVKTGAANMLQACAWFIHWKLTSSGETVDRRSGHERRSGEDRRLKLTVER